MFKRLFNCTYGVYSLIEETTDSQKSYRIYHL